jgi:hypothetical protein
MVFKFCFTEQARTAVILELKKDLRHIGPIFRFIQDFEMKAQRADWIKAYEERFNRFKETLIQRGYYQEREREA